MCSSDRPAFINKYIRNFKAAESGNDAGFQKVIIIMLQCMYTRIFHATLVYLEYIVGTVFRLH